MTFRDLPFFLQNVPLFSAVHTGTLSIGSKSFKRLQTTAVEKTSVQQWINKLKDQPRHKRNTRLCIGYWNSCMSSIAFLHHRWRRTHAKSICWWCRRVLCSLQIWLSDIFGQHEQNFLISKAAFWVIKLPPREKGTKGAFRAKEQDRILLVVDDLEQITRNSIAWLHKHRISVHNNPTDNHKTSIMCGSQESRSKPGECLFRSSR